MGKYILLGLLCALVLFILITVIRAIFFVPKKRKYAPLPEEKIDVDRALKNISSAIQFRTVSYSDADKTDWEQFRLFHKFLADAYPLITKTLNREVISDASLLYHWKGKNPDLDPIALLSHQDVVPISENTEKDWKYPPFSGTNDGEFIYGRGALDMKNHLICVMEAVETLLEEGFVPERDVYLCFGHNEEVVAGSGSGASAIMETLRSRGVTLDSVLDEGGAVLPVRVKGLIEKKLVSVGISEKGYCDCEISLNSKGGHSSQPPKHTGLGKMAEVISDLENHQFKAKLMPFMRSLIESVGRNAAYPARLVVCNHRILTPVITAIMKSIPPAACMVRTTTAVTMAHGSQAPNVMPQKSSIVANFRMMPGTTTKDVEEHIRKVVKNKDIEIKVIRTKEASPFSPTDSRAFNVIRDIYESQSPDYIVAPYLVMGGTDACYYEPICKNVYRFAPFNMTVELLRTTHATNERVPVSTVGEGVEFFKRYIERMAKE
ncbi:MAG: M20/M25/M40 family metallo-hydrolase [Clostridiales bacterium]|nr:M20/M25/M40 family metallo-hydrolase [Clostridiales bacterium]